MGYSTLVDDNYVVIGAHIDSSLHDRIKRGEYVDFSQLLPRDRVHAEEGKLELVNKGGQTYFIPAVERDAGGINNFGKWEQAFQVFTNIYVTANPSRAAELVQYNHVIFTAGFNIFLGECLSV